MKRLVMAFALALLGSWAWAQSPAWFIDFGPDDVTNGNPTISPDANGNHWNNVINQLASAPQVPLVDATNQSTGAYLQVTTDFLKNGILNGGLLSPSAALLGEVAIATATEDYFFSTSSSSLEFGGLPPGDGYVFHLFGTRQTTITRETDYTLTGANTFAASLLTSGAGIGANGYDGNNDSVLVSDTIYADVNGKISLAVSVVQGGFAYLGLAKVQPVGPPPSNQAPIADAGTDQFLPAGSTTATLSGQASDIDGDPLTMSWVQVAGPTVTITDSDSLSASVAGLADGQTYQFAFTADDGALTDSDTVSVSVREPAARNIIHSFLVDLGPNDGTNGNFTSSPDANGNYWNNVVDGTVSGNSVKLRSSLDQATAAELTVSAELLANGIQNGGLLSPDPNLLGDIGIATATQDYFFTVGNGTLLLEDLNPARGYVFHLFGSRNTSSVRSTEYTLTGASVWKDTLQTSGPDLGGAGYNGNNQTILESAIIRPDSAGTIELNIGVVEGGFAYLNMMRIDEVSTDPRYLVDFGPNDGTNGNLTPSPYLNGRYWNNVIDPTAAGDTLFLVNQRNDSLGAYVKVAADFLANGILNGGLLNPADSLLGELAIPTATQDYFFVTGTGSLTFGGLDPAYGYVFSAFGTRNSSSVRASAYTYTGAGTHIDTLQTSGPDLGGIGYNGNNANLAVSDTLYPTADGTITLDLNVVEGGFAYLGMLSIEEIRPVTEPEPEPLIAVMGSSVADGFGATNSEGYAFQYTQLLQQRYDAGIGAEFDVVNISVGGNNTIAVLNRWDSDLLPLNADYVIYGLSLGNEGITSQGQTAFDQFRDNMLLLIQDARDEGIEPVVVNCYTRADFTATDYQFIKDMNLLIHEWDVASVNVLGAIDDGAGRWAQGYEADPFHPNTAGHAEFFYAMVPSLFDALETGKPQPQLVTNTYLNIDRSQEDYQLVYTPEATLHPFTHSFELRTGGSGPVAGFTTDDGGSGGLIIDATTGTVRYESSQSAGITGSTVVNDSTWHRITLSHYYAMGKTFLYVDDVLQGSVEENLEGDQFILGESNAPSADYRNWFLYRSGMNDEEVAALHMGAMLKSSLSLYAPLDGLSGLDSTSNLAQSLNEITVEPASPFLTALHLEAELIPFDIYPNPSPGSSHIAFTLTERSQVHLRLVNLQGQEIARLYEGQLLPGNHQFSWESGPNLASGMFLCVLEVNGRSFTRRLVQLR